jgi:ATP-dependent DNA helicase
VNAEVDKSFTVRETYRGAAASTEPMERIPAQLVQVEGDACLSSPDAVDSAPGGDGTVLATKGDDALLPEKRRRYEHLDRLLKAATLYSSVLAEQIRQQQESYRSKTDQSASPTGKERTGRTVSRAGETKLKTLVEAADRDHIDVRRTEVRDAGSLQLRELSGGVLRDYQLAGLEWLVSLYENGINGILADEMGLGKTVQCIALICHLRAMGVRGPFLIVGPLTVLPNWMAEFQRFAPTVPALLYHGTKSERQLLRKRHLNERNGALSMPVIVTSYEMVMRDRAFLSKHRWAYIIIDEGHRIKNMDCQLLRELQSYSSANRLLITGTPLQNNLDELWSLLHFLMPDIFDSVELFREWFDFGSDVAAGAMEKQQEDAIVSKLHTILRPFMLRRLKSDVEKNMPKKREIYLFAPLSPLQREYYTAIMQDRMHELLDSRHGHGFSRQITLRNKFMQLRKVCCHPYLIAEPEENFSYGAYPMTDERLVQAAGKLALADRLLPRLRARGHKVLLYSQFTSMLDILEDYLRLRGHKYARIDGSVKFEDRIQQMEAFNAPESELFIFLLSTRAGGLGLNLQAADTVILYDSDPNPQMDLQAMDRCHRIGQRRPVHVYRFVTPNSVEERMLSRATEKRKLERLVVTRGHFYHDSTETSSSRESNQTTPDENARPAQAMLSFDEMLAQKLSAMEENPFGLDTAASKEEVERMLEELVNFAPAEAEYGNGGQITDGDLDALMDRADMIDQEAESSTDSVKTPRRTRNKRVQGVLRRTHPWKNAASTNDALELDSRAVEVDAQVSLEPTPGQVIESSMDPPPMRRRIAQGPGFQIFESGGESQLFQ